MLEKNSIADLRAAVALWRRQGARIGFVPTMGSLHEGHLSLLRLARMEADKVIASIFVNPLQFGPGEDYERYPRSPKEDRALLQAAGCDLLFMPSVQEMYPGGGVSATRVSVPGLATQLCGAVRPGHFDGVATVVARLFGIVQPDVAVFGEKDYQQLTVIRQMVSDLALPVQIVGAPTLRAEDGLALSSRNRYLSESERSLAPQLYATLQAIAKRLREGELDVRALQAWGESQLDATGLKPDYCEIRDAMNLASLAAEAPKLSRSLPKEMVVLAAVRLGRARLIDNLRVAL